MQDIYTFLRVYKHLPLTFFICITTWTLQANNPNNPEKRKIEDLAITITHTDVTCYALQDGTAKVLATGGAAPYTYLWNTGSTADTLSGLSPGTYSVTVEDANGETMAGDVTIINPPLLYATVFLSDSILTCDIPNLTATIEPLGGTAPLTFEWTFPYNIIESGQTVTIASPANYVYTVIDANGCTFSSDTTITSQGIPIVLLELTDTVSCNGLNDGSASVMVTGGTAPYFYQWSNGDQVDTLVDVHSGAYTLTVTDSEGCVGQSTVFIPQPNTLTLTITGNDVTCFGQSTGAIFTTVSGGTPGYEYLWNNGSPNSQLFNIEAGNYQLTVTDAHGCVTTGGVTIVEGNEINIFTSALPITCFGGNNGQALAFATGGAGAFMYNWSNGAQGAQATNLTAGVYTVFVTDLQNCVESTTVNVIQPDEIELFLNSLPEVLGGQDGSASVTVIGGIQPYSYIWNTGSTQSAISGLTAGVYTVTVTDQNGCSKIDSVTVLPSNCAFSASLIVINPSCFGADDGAIFPQIDVPGAEPYFYQWSDNTHDVILDSLSAGSYSVTIYDNANCQLTLTGVVVNPSPVTVQHQVTQPTGPENPTGTIELFMSGGLPPYKATYNGIDYISGSNIVIVGIPSGPHTITVSDSKGCTVIVQFSIDQFDCQISGNIVLENEPSCNGSKDGKICVEYSDNFGPVTIDWSNSQHTDCISNIGAGTYMVVVRDTLGCAFTKEYILDQPAVITLMNVNINQGTNNFDGFIKLNVLGGTPPFTYRWTKDGEDFATTRDINGLNAGTYQFYVTDSKGCTATFEPIIIKVSADNDLNIALNLKVFPNPTNGMLNIEGSSYTGEIQGITLTGLNGTKKNLNFEKTDRSKVRIDISNAASGAYILGVISENKTTYIRIIKAD